MKNIALIVMTVMLFGCAYKGENLETYVDEPANILKDPHYGHYKEERDALESQYLRKEIDYAVYTQKIEELDAKYNKEVDQRNAILEQE
jgi:hypothetical protein